MFHFFCCSSVGTFGTNFPRLIINQFKWLDRLLDSQVGTDVQSHVWFFQSTLEHLLGGMRSIIMLMRTDVVFIFTCWRKDLILFVLLWSPSVTFEHPLLLFFFFPDSKSPFFVNLYLYVCIHMGDPILKLLLAGSYNPLLFNFNRRCWILASIWGWILCSGFGGSFPSFPKSVSLCGLCCTLSSAGQWVKGQLP